KGGTLGWHKKLHTSNSDDGVTISVPANPPDKISSTIVLQLKGAPEVGLMSIIQKRDGSVSLPAREAHLHGTAFQYESAGPLDDIGYWTNPDDWADWDFKVAKPGRFEVSAVIAAPAGSPFDISVGGQTVHCKGPATGNYITFQTVELGSITIPAAGT